MRKITTVATWRESLRWYSQRVNMALISVAPVWLALPEDMRASIPQTWLAVFAATMGVLGFAGRLISQDDGDAK